MTGFDGGAGLQFKIYLIGSSLTSIGSSRSDIDLCMVIYNSATGQVDERYHHRFYAEAMLNRISAILEGAGLAFNTKVIRANVPILKFFDQNQIEVNLNLNKLVTVQNTMLLVHLCSLDSRVAPFLFNVKLWAQKNGINCAYFKSLSSYSLSLMAIFFLQNIVTPSILPPFSDLIDYVIQCTSLFEYQFAEEAGALSRLAGGASYTPTSRDFGLHVTTSVPFVSIIERLPLPIPSPPPPPPMMVAFEEHVNSTNAFAANDYQPNRSGNHHNNNAHHNHQLHQCAPHQHQLVANNSSGSIMPQLKAPELSGSAISRVTFLDSSLLPPNSCYQQQQLEPSQAPAQQQSVGNGKQGKSKKKKNAAKVAANAIAQVPANPNQMSLSLGIEEMDSSKHLPYYYYYYYYYYWHQFQLLQNKATEAMTGQCSVTSSSCASSENGDANMISSTSNSNYSNNSCASSRTGSLSHLPFTSSGDASRASPSSPFSTITSSNSPLEFKSTNVQSLGSLFADFISFYSDESVFDSVISVRTGCLMKRTDPHFARSSATSMDTFICIEEPFNHSNTSHSVHNDFMFKYIVKSFRWTRESINKLKLNMHDFV